jgi:predicted nucleotidyltransferase
MNQKHLQRQDALDILRRYKPIFERRYGVTALGVFGSVSRDEATESSDLDVVVRMRNPDLFALVHIKETLEQAFEGRVDIVHYRERMNAFLKKRIEQEAIYV